MSTNHLHQETEISDFYQHIRDYWMLLSSSTQGEPSNMLNFGYWPEPVKDLFEAQQCFTREIRDSLPEYQNLVQGLEIGCGIGGISINMLKELPALSMTALDISPQQLSLATQNAGLARVDSRLTLCQGNAMDLPFASDTFDFTLCIESTFHYEDKASFFAENFRVLRPGGYAVLADITCEDVDQIRYRRGNHFESKQKYINHALTTGFVLESVKDIGPAVYQPLHEHVVNFNRKQRVPSGKYWSVVLHNYEQLAALGLMGYHFFLLKKPA